MIMTAADLAYYTDDPLMDAERHHHQMLVHTDEAGSAVAGYTLQSASCRCGRWTQPRPWDSHGNAEAYDEHMKAVQQQLHEAALAAGTLPLGTRVYHYGQQFIGARRGTGTIKALKGPYHDGSYEYLVSHGEHFARPAGPDNPETAEDWWSSLATRRAEPQG